MAVRGLMRREELVMPDRAADESHTGRAATRDVADGPGSRLHSRDRARGMSDQPRNPVSGGLTKQQRASISPWTCTNRTDWRRSLLPSSWPAIVQHDRFMSFPMNKALNDVSASQKRPSWRLKAAIWRLDRWSPAAGRTSLRNKANFAKLSRRANSRVMSDQPFGQSSS
jgi:hypothetical protein